MCEEVRGHVHSVHVPAGSVERGETWLPNEATRNQRSCMTDLDKEGLIFSFSLE